MRGCNVPSPSSPLPSLFPLLSLPSFLFWALSLPLSLICPSPFLNLPLPLQNKAFVFDHVFPPPTNQVEVYTHAAQPIVKGTRGVGREGPEELGGRDQRSWEGGTRGVGREGPEELGGKDQRSWEGRTRGAGREGPEELGGRDQRSWEGGTRGVGREGRTHCLSQGCEAHAMTTV